MTEPVIAHICCICTCMMGQHDKTCHWCEHRLCEKCQPVDVTAHVEANQAEPADAD